MIHSSNKRELIKTQRAVVHAPLALTPLSYATASLSKSYNNRTYQ